MVETNGHCIAAFDVRGNPAKLADSVKAYPKIIKPNGPAKKTSNEDAALKAKRKAKRAAAKKLKKGQD